MNVDLLIQKTISGTISEDELVVLEKALSEQPELRENLYIEQAMYQYRNQKLRSTLKAAIPGQSTQKFRSKKALLSLLTLLMVGILGYWLYTKASPVHTPNSFAEYQLNEKSVSPVRLMDNGVKKKNLWSAAVDAYSASHFEEALQLIKAIDQPNSEQRLYESLCLIYQDKPDYQAANQILTSLQASAESVVYDQALWYGALINIKLDRIAGARAQLSTIVQSRLWKHAEAQQLLKLIKTD